MQSRKRKPIWRQDTPRMQITTLVGAAEGELMNIRGGCASREAPTRALNFLRDAQEILRRWPNLDSWGLEDPPEGS